MATQTTVADVMTLGVVTVPPETPITEAARLMRDEDIGDVLVVSGEELRGIVTDRDLVVRALAEPIEPRLVRVEDVCSDEVHVVETETPVQEAVRLMREWAMRRLPVVDDSGRPVGMVSIGDLAREGRPDSALADIGQAPPNR